MDLTKTALVGTTLLSTLLLATLAVILGAGRVSFGPEEPQEQLLIKSSEPMAPHEELRRFSDTKSQFIDDLIAALKTREMELDERADTVAAREEAVALREAAFADVEDKLTRLKREIEAQQLRLDEDIMAVMTQSRTSRANVQRIAEMCSRMEPESAVDMLREMDPNIVAMILSMLDERPAAKILDAAAQAGRDGAAVAARWAKALQEMKEDEIF